MATDSEERLQRIEYILMRLATTSPDVLPQDAHAQIAEIVQDVRCRKGEESVQQQNTITALLIHHLASTGPTPGPDELPQVYGTLINDLTELVVGC